MVFPVAVFLAALVVGCSSSASPPNGRGPATAPHGSAEVVASHLKVPWGVGFLPGGDALVTERDTAQILRVSQQGKVSTAGTVPGVDPTGEGGLLGLALSPHFQDDRLVYVYYSSTKDDNRIATLTYRNGELGAPQPILTGIPHGPVHNGGRIVFGPDGMLYASTGDATVGSRAQDRGSLGGKILRMTPSGKPAPGNPFPGSRVYSFGHRNVEGLAFDSQGRLWASEFGENTWDELNLIVPGGNYGWPVVEGRGDDARFRNPIHQWHTSEASPSGIAIVDDVIYMATLRGDRVYRMVIHGDTIGTPRSELTGNYGRLRTVQQTPDGSLWLTTSNRDGRGDPSPSDDRILSFPPG